MSIPSVLLSFCLFSASLAFSQTVSLVTIPDKTGDAAAHQIQTSGTCKALQIIAQVGNAAVVRIGDSTVSASAGLPIAAGGGLFLPPITFSNGSSFVSYKLSAMYYYAGSGDVVSIACIN